jgi:hypothetical protein
MTSYAEKCPDARLILLGYSQGGSVALDTLGGGGGPVFKCEQEENAALDRTKVPGSNSEFPATCVLKYMAEVFLVAAAVVFGAVVRTAGEPYTASGVEKLRGGTNFNGTSPRSEAHLAGLQPYSEILREYCNFGDPICAVGSVPQDVAQHLNYFKLYVEDAAEWVVETVEGNLESRENVTAPASTSNSASKTKATATAMSAHASKTHAVSSHVEAASSHVEAVAATTSSPESSASKHHEVFGGTAIVAVGYGVLLSLL